MLHRALGAALFTLLTVAGCEEVTEPDNETDAAQRSEPDRDGGARDAELPQSATDAGEADASIVPPDRRDAETQAVLDDAGSGHAQSGDAQSGDAQSGDAGTTTHDMSVPVDLDASAVLTSAVDIAEPGRLCGFLALTTDTLVDVGHHTPLTNAVISGRRAVTQNQFGTGIYDNYARWVLWDLDTGRAIADGTAGPYVDFATAPAPRVIERAELAGSTLLIPLPIARRAGQWSFEVRHASDGRLLGTGSRPSSSQTVHLSVDGSYVWSSTDSSPAKTTIWDLSGEILLDNIEGTAIFAAPSELRVRRGQTMARISIADGTTVTSELFIGDKVTWFQDGQRFLASSGAAVRIYGADGSLQLGLTAVAGETVGGAGDYFWSLTALYGRLALYRIGVAEPVLQRQSSVTKVAASPSTLTLLSSDESADGKPSLKLEVIDLRGGNIVLRTYRGPDVYRTYGIAAGENSSWIAYLDATYVGNPDGSVERLGCAGPTSIAGSDNGRVAVSTGSGRVYLFDLLPTPHLVGTLNVQAKSQRLSSDGNVLAVSKYGSPADVGKWPALLRLPSGAPLELGPYAQPAHTDAASTAPLVDVRLGSRGPNVVKTVCNTSAQAQFGIGARKCRREVTDFSAALLSSSEYDLLGSPIQTPVAVSADGLKVAATESQSVKLYDGSTLTGVIGVNEAPLGWLDATRLMLPSGVYSTEGGKLSGVGGGRIVSSTEVYRAAQNQITAVSDGSILWRGPAPHPFLPAADVAGRHAVFIESSLAQHIKVVPF
jgi:hypothetical protein